MNGITGIRTAANASASKLCIVCGESIPKNELSYHLLNCVRGCVKPFRVSNTETIACPNCHQNILKEFIGSHISACQDQRTLNHFNEITLDDNEMRESSMFINPNVHQEKSNRLPLDDFQVIPTLAKGSQPPLNIKESVNDEIIQKVPCQFCNRGFSSDALERHLKICQGLSNKKKRKVFDVAKARLRGTELENYAAPKSQKESQSKDSISTKSKKSNWRFEHEKFMRIVRQARTGSAKDSKQEGSNRRAKGANLKSTPPEEDNPDYVTCPHCVRRFQEQTAERHIPHCKEMKEKEARRIEQKLKTEELLKKSESLKRRTAYKPKALSLLASPKGPNKN